MSGGAARAFMDWIEPRSLMESAIKQMTKDRVRPTSREKDVVRFVKKDASGAAPSMAPRSKAPGKIVK